MILTAEHPKYLYLFHDKYPKDEVVFINFETIIFDNHTAEKYIENELEFLGVSPIVYQDTKNISTNLGIYNLNLHIDLLYNYLVNRGNSFEDILGKILEIFFHVYRNGSKFIRHDICQFIHRYSTILDFVVYSFGHDQFFIDKRFSSGLSESIYANAFMKDYDERFLIEFQKTIISDLNYKKAFLIDSDEYIRDTAAKYIRNENFKLIDVPSFVSDDFESKKFFDNFEFLII